MSSLSCTACTTTDFGWRKLASWFVFCWNDWGESSCPRSATVIHSLAVGQKTNLSVERQAVYYWAIASPMWVDTVFQSYQWVQAKNVCKDAKILTKIQSIGFMWCKNNNGEFSWWNVRTTVKRFLWLQNVLSQALREPRNIGKDICNSLHLMKQTADKTISERHTKVPMQRKMPLCMDRVSSVASKSTACKI